MNISIVASCAGGFNGSFLLLLREFLKSVVYRLRDQGTLLDPAFGTASGAYPDKTPFALQDLKAIAVFHYSSFGKYRGDVVAQDSLRYGDVSDLLHFASAAPTAQKREKKK
jgi:hypothetical protein